MRRKSPFSVELKSRPHLGAFEVSASWRPRQAEHSLSTQAVAQRGDAASVVALGRCSWPGVDSGSCQEET